MPFLCEKK
uniref:Uncharacterized protein n=1 Tax=Anguilla anguilla TaxID=7936 RepID=A0A0E9TFS7_ANGAN